MSHEIMNHKIMGRLSVVGGGHVTIAKCVWHSVGGAFAQWRYWAVDWGVMCEGSPDWASRVTDPVTRCVSEGVRLLMFSESSAPRGRPGQSVGPGLDAFGWHSSPRSALANAF